MPKKSNAKTASKTTAPRLTPPPIGKPIEKLAMVKPRERKETSNVFDVSHVMVADAAIAKERGVEVGTLLQVLPVNQDVCGRGYDKKGNPKTGCGAVIFWVNALVKNAETGELKPSPRGTPVEVSYNADNVLIGKRHTCDAYGSR